MTDADTPIRAAAALSLAEAFGMQAILRPDAPALVQDGRVLSYRALDDRAGRLAAVLAASGVGAGDRVAMLSENRAEYLELFLAAARLGAVIACQNWRLAAPELAHCLRLVAPKLALVSARHAAALAGTGHAEGRTLLLGDAYERMLAAAAPLAPRPLDPESGLLILYTSGTTGLPKGALISHRAMLARAMVAAADWRIGTEAFVAWTPLFHMGAADEALATLLGGGTVFVMDGFDAAALAALIAREPIGHLTVVPGIVDRLLTELRAAKAPPAGVRVVGVMADLVPPAQIAELTALLGAPYGNTFGSTETGMPPASRGLIPPGVAPTGLAKTQSSFCAVRLLDPEGRDVAEGEAGELAMRGPTLFSGYWGDAAANAEAFRNGWFHMGDVFRRNPDGTLDFVDRRKYLIKSGGENIYPAEVERALLAVPGVADAAVVRRADARWGEVPVAFVVRQDETLTEAALLAACRTRIAGYKLPKAVLFVADADLPRSTSGKIQRHLLEQRLAAAGGR
jgi:acyl-CoA synthetase (AMP-forming)/AMP-acid ligase II